MTVPGAGFICWTRLVAWQNGYCCLQPCPRAVEIFVTQLRRATLDKTARKHWRTGNECRVLLQLTDNAGPIINSSARS